MADFRLSHYSFLTNLEILSCSFTKKKLVYTETCIESMQNVKKEGIVMALWGKTGTKGQNKYSKKCPNKP